MNGFLHSPPMLLARVVVLMAAASQFSACEVFQGAEPAREWQEGTVMHYDNGMGYKVSADTAFPHYSARLGKGYVEVYENTRTHYHKLVNKKTGADEYVRCFARPGEDGKWVHKPQWDEDPFHDPGGGVVGTVFERD